MPTTDDCLFCKIARGDIKAAETYRDDRTVAFKDIGPKAPLHQLVIPRQHVGTLAETDGAHEALLGHMMVTAAHLAREAGYGEKGFRVVMNSGVGAGQSVFHLHLHVLAGRSFGWPPG
jgi:diadenosine tetraphosphate (Ap4A) HIT family hydrolase